MPNKNHSLNLKETQQRIREIGSSRLKDSCPVSFLHSPSYTAAIQGTRFKNASLSDRRYQQCVQLAAFIGTEQFIKIKNIYLVRIMPSNSGNLENSDYKHQPMVLKFHINNKIACDVVGYHYTLALVNDDDFKDCTIIDPFANDDIPGVILKEYIAKNIMTLKASVKLEFYQASSGKPSMQKYQRMQLISHHGFQYLNKFLKLCHTITDYKTYRCIPMNPKPAFGHGIDLDASMKIEAFAANKFFNSRPKCCLL